MQKMLVTLISVTTVFVTVVTLYVVLGPGYKVYQRYNPPEPVSTVLPCSDYPPSAFETYTPEPYSGEEPYADYILRNSTMSSQCRESDGTIRTF